MQNSTACPQLREISKSSELDILLALVCFAFFLFGLWIFNSWTVAAFISFFLSSAIYLLRRKTNKKIVLSAGELGLFYYEGPKSSSSSLIIGPMEVWLSEPGKVSAEIFPQSQKVTYSFIVPTSSDDQQECLRTKVELTLLSNTQGLFKLNRRLRIAEGCQKKAIERIVFDCINQYFREECRLNLPGIFHQSSEELVSILLDRESKLLPLIKKIRVEIQKQCFFIGQDYPGFTPDPDPLLLLENIVVSVEQNGRHSVSIEKKF